jgi:dTDP-4-amino-4,6-dideoxygalactose transaminase
LSVPERASLRLPFNRPFVTGEELDFIGEAIANGHLSGNGPFTQRCTEWLEQNVGTTKALLTHSCTAALEMAALLSDVGPGDEVIMPSFTFVSTANAFVLRGATPVFVDIRKDTLNIDEEAVATAITPRTRVIAVVHYAGVGADMDSLNEVAAGNDLLVVEDAAQGMLASLNGRSLGTMAPLAALSFHETKNVLSGEGGALLINDPRFIERAEIIQEKGTNRSRFFRGEVDKYTWVEPGSSYAPSEINAAFLWAQLKHAEAITSGRLALWNLYDEALAPLEQAGLIRRPVIPAGAEHNAHMYYILLANEPARERTISALRARGAHAVFHYVPLHSAYAGRKYGRAEGELKVTDDVSERLLRLPLWHGMTPDDVEIVAETVSAALTVQTSPR